MKKFFIINIEYCVELDVIDKILSAHRDWLEIQYQKGLLLCSGPKEPRTGGVVIAFGSDLSQIKELFKADPFNVHQVATYSFIEFNPVKYHQDIKALIA